MSGTKKKTTAPKAQDKQEKKPAQANDVQVHPFVEILAHQLVPTTRDQLSKLVFTDVGIKKAEELLRSVFSQPAEFQLAVQSLSLFVQYLREERDSPNAATSLQTLITTLIDEQGKHNITREEDQREKVGEEFKKFTAKKPSTEDDVRKDVPTIPAKDLLRGQFKR